ncbi:MAG: AAA family ATPase [Candidatus Micrarchaeota archaeon]|nr:AAA family ATPase [Candidatus Micrarchaeota archaeon]
MRRERKINARNYRLDSFNIKNFRSINNLSMNFPVNDLMIICGANNVGKTNFLRALDLFFSLDSDKFNEIDDIPYFISEGSRGGGYKTTFNAIFISDSFRKVKIKAIFEKIEGEKRVTVTGKLGRQNIREDRIRDFISGFRFIFIESSNIDITNTIAQILNSDVLLTLANNKKNKIVLDDLNKFIEESKNSVKRIQDEITTIIKETVEGIEGIDPTKWKAEILFPEFKSLRDAISNLVVFTLNDSNNRVIKTKGSGIQRVVLFSLIQYISDSSGKNIIWGIDEPEVFLQPALQKKMQGRIAGLAKSIPIIITTHSHNFIDLKSMDHTYLFEASKVEAKQYKRKPNQTFYESKTLINSSSGIEKINLIKRHLGITRGDTWELLPYNLLVEGEDDKMYINSLMEFYGIEKPNIFVAEGADKAKNYLNFLNDYAKEIKYRPKVLCILDHDNKGIEVYKYLQSNSNKYGNLEVTATHMPRFDGRVSEEHRYEIEDFLPKEMVLDAVNYFLYKKGYQKLGVDSLSNRTNTAYDKKEILNLLSLLAVVKNPDLKDLDLSSPEIKKYLCKIICDSLKINQNNYGELLKQNQIIKNFISSIAT